MAAVEAIVEADLTALDATGEHQRSASLRRAWSAVWPKLAAAGIALIAWQAVVWTHWRPEYVLPAPGTVLRALWRELTGPDLTRAVGITLGRAGLGYAVAVVIGTAIGLAVARVRVVRAAVGSLITGLQTMPSIAWFPLAILLFRLSEGAILFVVVLGAAPAIANGLVSGVDGIPPILLRAGRMLGARGFAAYRHVILPAAFPGFVSGLKQGWAFAWRSLMAGELLVIIDNRPSIGDRLSFALENVDAEGIIAMMLVILAIGVLVDAVLFRGVERAVRRRWGLIDSAAE